MTIADNAKQLYVCFVSSVSFLTYLLIKQLFSQLLNWWNWWLYWDYNNMSMRNWAMERVQQWARVLLDQHPCVFVCLQWLYVCFWQYPCVVLGSPRPSRFNGIPGYFWRSWREGKEPWKQKQASAYFQQHLKLCSAKCPSPVNSEQGWIYIYHYLYIYTLFIYVHYLYPCSLFIYI